MKNTLYKQDLRISRAAFYTTTKNSFSLKRACIYALGIITLCSTLSIFSHDITFFSALIGSTGAHFPEFIAQARKSDGNNVCSNSSKDIIIKLIRKDALIQKPTQFNQDLPISAHITVKPKIYSYYLCYLKIAPHERNNKLGSRIIAWLKAMAQQTNKLEITLSAEYIESGNMPHAMQLASYLKTLNFYKKNGAYLNFCKKIPSIFSIEKHMRLPLVIPTFKSMQLFYETEQTKFIKRRLELKSSKMKANLLKKRNAVYRYPSSNAYSYTSGNYATLHTSLSLKNNKPKTKKNNKPRANLLKKRNPVYRYLPSDAYSYTSCHYATLHAFLSLLSATDSK